MLDVIFGSLSSTILACDISSTVNQSTLTETVVSGPVSVYIDDAKLVSSDVFSFDDEPVIVDMSPRLSIRRLIATCCVSCMFVHFHCRTIVL